MENDGGAGFTFTLGEGKEGLIHQVTLEQRCKGWEGAGHEDICSGRRDSMCKGPAVGRLGIVEEQQGQRGSSRMSKRKNSGSVQRVGVKILWLLL